MPCSACCLQACICVAGAALGQSVCCLCRRRPCVSWRVPLAVSRLAFAWQGQHLGTLSVVCVAGVQLCRVVACSACCLQACMCVAGAALGQSVCCLCRRPPCVSWRVVACSACCPGLHLRGRGSTWAVCLLCVAGVRVCRGMVACSACCLHLHLRGRGSTWAVCLLSVSPASVCVVACRGVFRLLSPGLHLRGTGSAWAVCCLCRRRPCVSWRVVACSGCSLCWICVWQTQHLGVLSVVCVAGVRVCYAVSRRVPVALSAGFAWQGQHFGVLSVVCVAGNHVCYAVSRRVPAALSAGFAWQAQHFRRPVCCLCRQRPCFLRCVPVCSASSLCWRKTPDAKRLRAMRNVARAARDNTNMYAN